ncbi:MAG: cobalt-precorrin-5B (C(1))-methyltransferase [Proteobacteria bacterium]|nr:cobalt-precorrin-5B (C(1))-methyltransferase [Pseudomonadota bacterium]MBU1639146.1 cobalt-precorrin-5B (C(1))-methyltransferase [Pseudomonadota bacterium]
MKGKGKKLRSGYTTGACAAAAAKAAAEALFTGICPDRVEIPFPDGSRVTFMVNRCETRHEEAEASVIKDAGDDPDVTNGAEIVAVVGIMCGCGAEAIEIRAGFGVGTITKPGLALEVGQAAINPVPRRMIKEAVTEVLDGQENRKDVIVFISVPNGEELATKTLNKRLGIIGGLSILGTTGIVRPVSAEAWTATIAASMSVARKAGLTEVVISTGRTSEAAVQKELTLPEEAYAMMGDYLEFSLKEAAKQGFTKIHLAAMWAKVLKCAMQIPQTHVRHGALEVDEAITFLGTIGLEKELQAALRGSNTAREVYVRLKEQHRDDIIKKVCLAAQAYGEKVSGLPVTVSLVDGQGHLVMTV